MWPAVITSRLRERARCVCFRRSPSPPKLLHHRARHSARALRVQLRGGLSGPRRSARGIESRSLSLFRDRPTRSTETKKKGEKSRHTETTARRSEQAFASFSTGSLDPLVRPRVRTSAAKVRRQCDSGVRLERVSSEAVVSCRATERIVRITRGGSRVRASSRGGSVRRSQCFRSPGGSSSLREAEGGEASIARHFAERPTSSARIDDILPRDIFGDTEDTAEAAVRSSRA